MTPCGDRTFIQHNRNFCPAAFSSFGVLVRKVFTRRRGAAENLSPRRQASQGKEGARERAKPCWRLGVLAVKFFVRGLRVSACNLFLDCAAASWRMSRAAGHGRDVS